MGGPTGFSHRSLGGASAFLAARFRGGINIFCDSTWGGTVIFTFCNYGGHKLFYIKSGEGTRKQHIIVYKMTSVSIKWGAKENFGKK